MSYASSKTLYILNYQSVDLVLTTDGIKVDNRPMNQQRPGSMANTDPDTEPENDPENEHENENEDAENIQQEAIEEYNSDEDSDYSEDNEEEEMDEDQIVVLLDNELNEDEDDNNENQDNTSFTDQWDDEEFVPPMAPPLMRMNAVCINTESDDDDEYESDESTLEYDVNTNIA
mgnify:CR=1 FL=1